MIAEKHEIEEDSVDKWIEEELYESYGILFPPPDNLTRVRQLMMRVPSEECLRTAYFDNSIGGPIWPKKTGSRNKRKRGVE